MAMILSDSLLSSRAHALSHRFSCSAANGEPLSLPPRPSTKPTASVISADVAVGMLVGSGGGGESLQLHLLQHARASWMPRMAGAGVLLLADCPNSRRTRMPTWLRVRRPVSILVLRPTTSNNLS